MTTSARAFDGPGDLRDALRATGYLASDEVATAAWLSLTLAKPLFCEGEPGTGKTSLATALAEATGTPLVRLQCHEGLTAEQALYDWDFPRQVLHLRAVEAAARVAGDDGTPIDAATLEHDLYDAAYLLERPVLAALRKAPCVLLVDEVDRADDAFEAFLLEVLADHAVTIPEVGRVAAAVPPTVVLTSNRTREVHDALKRRCHYLWVAHPDHDTEVAIVHARLPDVGERLARQVVEAVQALRRRGDLLKPPGVAETLDWVAALRALGADELAAREAELTLGSVVKLREDAVSVDVAALVASVTA